MKTMNHIWGTIQRLASDRGGGALVLPYTTAGIMGSKQVRKELS